jgi:hypothetical protein
MCSLSSGQVSLYHKRVSLWKNDECFPVVIVARYLHELILHQNKLLLDKAGPNGIAPLAGMKGNLLPRLGITIHEYYLSDRLGEARTQSVAGRNKSESLRSIDHEHIFISR